MKYQQHITFVVVRKTQTQMLQNVNCGLNFYNSITRDVIPEFCAQKIFRRTERFQRQEQKFSEPYRFKFNNKFLTFNRQTD